MKLIKEQYMMDRKGKMITINVKDDEDSEPVPVTLTVRWILEKLATTYVPDHVLTLQIGELRNLYRALDVLENEVNIGDNIELENECFESIKKVVTHLLPAVTILPILACAPQVDDILQAVT